MVILRLQKQSVFKQKTLCFSNPGFDKKIQVLGAVQVLESQVFPPSPQLGTNIRRCSKTILPSVLYRKNTELTLLMKFCDTSNVDLGLQCHVTARGQFKIYYFFCVFSPAALCSQRPAHDCWLPHRTPGKLNPPKIPLIFPNT